MKRKKRRSPKKQHKKAAKKRKKSHKTSKPARPRRAGIISDEMAAILIFVREPSDVIVRKNPILLRDTCLKELANLERGARTAGKAPAANVYAERLELLRLCRTVGIDTAFKQTGSVPADLRKILKDASSLSSGLADRPLVGQDLKKLDASARLWKEAIAKPTFVSLPRDLRLKAMSDAGGVFLLRFQNLGEISDLDTAIDVLDRGLEDTPRNFPERSHLLSNLAASYRARYDETGSADDLGKAVQSCEELLSIIAPDAPDYRTLLSNIGMLTSRLFEVTGRLSDLQKSIGHLRTAIDHKEEGSQDDYKILGNLGILLCHRFESTGSIKDLDEAITHLETAGRLASDIGRPAFLGSLASALCDRFERRRDKSDIDRAIRLHKEDLNSVPKTSVARHRKLNDLAVALKARFRLTQSEGDLQEAIVTLEKAQDLIPGASPIRFKVMLNLQSALINLYLLKKDSEHLDTAIRIAERALPLLGQDSPWSATVLLAYSEALLLRGDDNSDPEDITSARALFQDASRVDIEHAPYYFLTVARRWATWELKNENWEKAIEAGEKGVESITSLLERNLLRSHKESWLRDAQGLAALLAYAHAKLGEYRRAVELLEAGQARLLTEVLGKDRRRLDGLRESGHSKLYGQYCELTNKIEGLANSESTGSQSTEVLEATRARLREVLEAIRQIEGYEDFLIPATFDRLRSAAKEAPIVYVFATVVGSAALAVTAGGCVLVWLDNLSIESLRRELLGDEDARKVGYFRSYLRWRTNTTDTSAFNEWADTIDCTTRLLFDEIMAPILVELSSNSELVIVPCGLLSLMPLHAAWTEDALAPDCRRYALDQCCIRFAPNGHTILAALRAESVEAPDRLLAVAEPKATKVSALPWADFEVACVCGVFPLNAQSRLDGVTAEEEAILKALDSATCFHFAGHATSSPMTPLEGGLILSQDSRLTVGRLLEQSFPRLQMAILSACETALPGVQLPDEVVGLPAALLSAGASRVIASLWTVADASTSLLMARFYQLWRQDGLKPADALRSAQRWLRRATRDDLTAWTSEQQKRYGVTTIPRIPKGERPFSAPFYWAAFTFNGR